MKNQEVIQQEPKGLNKIVYGAKTVSYFLLLLGMKAFKKKSNETLQKTAVAAREKHVGLFSYLFKSTYKFLKGDFVKQVSELKKSYKKKNKVRGSRKTWARVKQDFQEYYQDLQDEFANDEAEYLEKNNNEKKEPIRVNSSRRIEITK